MNTTSRLLAVSLLAVVLLFPAASSGQTARTSVFADALGAAGLYAVGVERAVWPASASERQLRIRVGGSFWTDDGVFALPGDGAAVDRVMAAPVGLTALLTLGRPLGIPTALDLGAGAVFVRRSGERFEVTGESFAVPRYAEIALRAQVGRGIGLRAGVTTGGEVARGSGSGGRAVFGVGVGL